MELRPERANPKRARCSSDNSQIQRIREVEVRTDFGLLEPSPVGSSGTCGERLLPMFLGYFLEKRGQLSSISTRFAPPFRFGCQPFWTPSLRISQSVSFLFFAPVVNKS